MKSSMLPLLALILSLIPFTGASSAEIGERKESSESKDISVTVERSGERSNLLRADVHFCSEITNKQCLDQRNSFTIDDDKIFCHTTVHGAKSYIEIKHIWYQGEKLDQTVRLPVQSSRWRTWSVKTLYAESGGDWRVEVYTGDMKIGEGQFSVAGKEETARENQ